MHRSKATDNTCRGAHHFMVRSPALFILPQIGFCGILDDAQVGLIHIDNHVAIILYVIFIKHKY